MNKEEFHKATENLRRAVPLMIKNQVPTTPTNYALWYTYVDQTQPALNEELDEIISEYGLCLPSHNEELYRRYIASQTEANVRELKTNLEVLVSEIFQSMKDTLDDTSAFQNMIDKNFENLAKIENDGITFDEVMGMLKEFVAESKEIRDSTKYFNSQLNSASKEISNLKKQLEEVQKDALYDSLSSLLNRGAFDKDMSSYCSSPDSHPLCLILIDIDKFKDLNDQYGHIFGDTVIKAIAKRLQISCREGIAAYRYGGEEFAMLVPNKSLRVARQFAESVRRAIEKITVKDKRTGEQIGNISASIGVAEFVPGESPIALIDNADKQLYKAKSLGRNRVMPL
ncbi:GGDEF domain-containing protein [Vibrio sp. JC009]|uniref:GGDEF domain-containing protein n=1 Tax=Vibrio sp. JC009 TaxID=2912314 RepID=UPI0023AFF476|nr:GGDEF domain-containing protein [Vibrio sp. JC009]WED23577.1 GGDEF domain-containing protein [Vibrio sp. JC009]